MFVIVLELFSLNVGSKNLIASINSRNIQIIRQNIIDTGYDTIYTIRQWAKANNYTDFSNLSLQKLNIPPKSKYTDYRIITDNTKVTIFNNTPYKENDNKKSQYKITYDILTDSIKTETNPVK